MDRLRWDDFESKRKGVDLKNKVIEFPVGRIRRFHSYGPKGVYVRPEFLHSLQGELDRINSKYRVLKLINYGLLGLCFYLMFKLP